MAASEEAAVDAASEAAAAEEAVLEEATPQAARLRLRTAALAMARNFFLGDSLRMWGGSGVAVFPPVGLPLPGPRRRGSFCFAGCVPRPCV